MNQKVVSGKKESIRGMRINATSTYVIMLINFKVVQLIMLRNNTFSNIIVAMVPHFTAFILT